MRLHGLKRRVASVASALLLLSLVSSNGGSRALFSQVPPPEDPGSDPDSQASAAYGIPDLYASFGLDFAVAIPFGEFSRNAGPGYGFTADLSMRLVRSGWLGLRVDGGAVWYGQETRHDTVHIGRVPLDIEATTRNVIAYGAIGPQVHFAGYPVSARVYGLLGLSYFETRTSAKFDTADPELQEIDLGSQVHLTDWTPSFAIGGELRWVIKGTRDGELFGLGLSVDWRRHGTTRYLVEGSITDVDGRAVFEPLKSRADFLLVSFGVWFGTW